MYKRIQIIGFSFMNIIAILVSLLVTTVAFIIISQLPTGVKIESFQKALIAAIVFGILNAILHPILDLLAAPLNFVTFGFLRGLFTLIINGFIFGLAAWLIKGFRLDWGVWSALIGAFALTVINQLITQFIPTVV
jgi:putative membrane protein